MSRFLRRQNTDQPGAAQQPHLLHSSSSSSSSLSSSSSSSSVAMFSPNGQARQTHMSHTQHNSSNSQNRTVPATAYSGNSTASINSEKPVYPETFVDYIVELSDGFNSDIKELVETGSNLFSNSLKLLFPSKNSNSNKNSESFSHLGEVEVSNSLENINPNTKCSSSKMLASSSAELRKNQVESAIRMRCPQTWSNPNPNRTMELYSQQSQVSKKKISLAKLASHKDIVHFPCSDDRIAIIGNKRLMVARKNNDNENTATEEWYVFLDDIDSCVLNFTSSLLSRQQAQLSMQMKDSSMREVIVDETQVCVKILQSIQSKRSSSTFPSTLRRDKIEQNAVQVIASKFLSKEVQFKDKTSTNSSSIMNNSNIHQNNSSLNNSTISALSSASFVSNAKRASDATSNNNNNNNTSHPGNFNYNNNNNNNSNSFTLSNNSSNTCGVGTKLSPKSFNRASVISKQLKHGVGESGIRDKLFTDGYDGLKIDLIIDIARKGNSNNGNNSNNNNNSSSSSSSSSSIANNSRRLAGQQGQDKSFSAIEVTAPVSILSPKRKQGEIDDEHCNSDSCNYSSNVNGNGNSTPVVNYCRREPIDCGAEADSGSPKKVRKVKENGQNNSNLDQFSHSSFSSINSAHHIQSNGATMNRGNRERRVDVFGSPIRSSELEGEGGGEGEDRRQTQPLNASSSISSLESINSVPTAMRKFAAMLQAQVPDDVVAARMVIDGVSEPNRNRLLRQFSNNNNNNSSNYNNNNNNNFNSNNGSHQQHSHINNSSSSSSGGGSDIYGGSYSSNFGFSSNSSNSFACTNSDQYSAGPGSVGQGMAASSSFVFDSMPSNTYNIGAGSNGQSNTVSMTSTMFSSNNSNNYPVASSTPFSANPDSVLADARKNMLNTILNRHSKPISEVNSGSSINSINNSSSNNNNNNSSSSSSSSSNCVVELPLSLKKFELMIKNGVPEGAVLAKMRMEGVADADQQRVLNNVSAIKAGAPSSSSSSSASSTSPSAKKAAGEKGELREDLKRFHLMIKRGVPVAAVMIKMSSEGLSEEDKDTVRKFSSDSDSSSSTLEPTSSSNSIASKAAALPLPFPPTPSTSSSSAIEDLPSPLKKYGAMLKNGIPEGAVMAKMRMEGVKEADQKRILSGVTVGYAKDSGPNSIAAGGGVKPNHNGPKLLGLHWEPLEKGNLSNTIWGDVCKSSSSLGDDEFSKLVNMFSKKPAVAKDAQVEVARPKVVLPTLIDNSRSMNIMICLTAMKSKSLSMDTICQGLDGLDLSLLSGEDLIRLKEILPVDAEIKLLKGNKDFENPARAFHDSERALFQLVRVEKSREKLECMIFLHTAVSHLDEIGVKVGQFSLMSDFLVSSQPLQEILRSILAIGNALNDGTWKGQACGFKLSSLAKLTQTKSVDGKETVLDYLTKILRSRCGNGDELCRRALDIDDDFRPLGSLKGISLSELDKDLKSYRSLYEKTSKLAEHVSDVGGSLSSRLMAISCKLVTLSHLAEEVKQKCGAMAEYFGEQAAFPPNSIFGILDDFGKDFKKSKLKAPRP